MNCCTFSKDNLPRERLDESVTEDLAANIVPAVLAGLETTWRWTMSHQSQCLRNCDFSPLSRWWLVVVLGVRVIVANSKIRLLRYRSWELNWNNKYWNFYLNLSSRGRLTEPAFKLPSSPYNLMLDATGLHFSEFANKIYNQTPFHQKCLQSSLFT